MESKDELKRIVHVITLTLMRVRYIYFSDILLDKKLYKKIRETF